MLKGLMMRWGGGLILLMLGVCGFLVSASMQLSNTKPDLATQIWPWNGQAWAIRAATLSVNFSTPSSLGNGIQDAKRALILDPGNPIAARAMSVLLSRRRDEGGATQWLQYSESMSRRDLPTQLALIEYAVNRGDVEGAVLHYDRALKTSRAAPPILFPTLINALSDNDISTAVAKRLQKRPLWRPIFLQQVVQGRPTAMAMANFLQKVQLDPKNAVDREFLGTAIARLVEQGEISSAKTLAGVRAGKLLKNGNFENSVQGFEPFEWSLSNKEGLTSYIDAIPDSGGRALLMHADPAYSGRAAEQLIAMRPGHYKLSYISGALSDGGGKIAMHIQCVPDGRSVLRNGPQTASISSAVTEFVVPAGCNDQMIIVLFYAPSDGEGNAWIDNIMIRPVSRDRQ